MATIIFFQMILNENIVTGSYIDTDQLMETLELPNLDYGSLIFQPGETLSQETIMNQDLVKISVPSSYDFTLSYEFPADKVGAHLSFVNRYSVLLCLVLILAFLLFLVLIHRIVIRPITHLNESMLRLGEGDLDYRIEKVADTSEFQLLYQTFNKMVNEIQNLKIKVYEEQLTAQRFKVNILQLQVKPHFIINTLNMVYNLLYAQQTESAESLILCTIKYFRFMMRITDNVIPVADEIEHIDAYVQIQKLRYMKNFDFVQEIHSLTREAMIPPLLIHQFVENSIKYAMNADHPLLIRLETQYLEIDYDPYIKIIIRDNGPGYSQELLAALNAGRTSGPQTAAILASSATWSSSSISTGTSGGISPTMEAPAWSWYCPSVLRRKKVCRDNYKKNPARRILRLRQGCPGSHLPSAAVRSRPEGFIS